MLGEVVDGDVVISVVVAESVTCCKDVMACDVECSERFFHKLLDEGVFLAP